MQFLAGGIAPHFVGVVFAVHIDGLRVPIRILARHGIAAFDDEDALAGGREPVSQCLTTYDAADYDHILVLHAGWSANQPNPYIGVDGENYIRWMVERGNHFHTL